MKILMLSWEFPPMLVGGLGRHVHALSTALAEAGHDVTVVTRHCPGASTDEKIDGVQVVRAPEDPPLFPLSTDSLPAWATVVNHAMTRAALSAARTTDFDVVHAHDWLVAHTAVTLKEQLRRPLVATIHATEAGRHQGWLPEEANRCIHSVEWWLGSQASRVLVCSQYMRWEVRRLLGVPPARVGVIPNGVNTADWRAPAAQVRAARARYRGYGPLIGYMGRLVHEKGVQDLLSAIPELRRRHPGLRLVVAGDGPYLPQLKALSRQLRIQRAVSFVGFQADALPALLAATDAMVVPSLYEPFGMVALEATAAGVPVAAASTGGLAEIVQPDRTGVVFPPGDSAALANAVSRILSNPRAAAGMVTAARRVVADRHLWPSIARRVTGVYLDAEMDAPGFTTREAADRSANRQRRLVVPDGNLLRDAHA